MNANGFLNHLLNMGYNIIIFLISIITTIIFLWIFVKIKRWYGKARIRRSRDDFKKTVDYIDDNEKNINNFQRLFLRLTGEVEGAENLKFMIIFILIWLVVLILIGLLLQYGFLEYDIVEKFLNGKTFNVIIIVGCVALELFFASRWIKSIIGLIKYARILPFLFWTMLLIVYGVILYQHITFFIN